MTMATTGLQIRVELNSFQAYFNSAGEGAVWLFPVILGKDGKTKAWERSLRCISLLAASTKQI